MAQHFTINITHGGGGKQPRKPPTGGIKAPPGPAPAPALPKPPPNQTPQAGGGGGGNAGGGASAQASGAKGGKGRGQGKQRQARGAAIGNLLNPGSLLSGHQLGRAAQALTNLQMRPQTRAYQNLINDLKSQETSDAAGLGNLGTRLSGQVSSTYRNLAQTEAQNVARQQALAGSLNSQAALNSTQASNTLASTQTGQLGALQEAMKLRGAPGGGTAQQQLANLVAQQQSQQAQRNQDQQNFANSQGAGYAQLAQAQGQAEQQRGAEAGSNIAQIIASRTAQSNLKAGASIQDAQSKLGDLSASRGDMLIKNLSDLRAAERTYILGKGAIAQRGSAAALAAATSRRGQNVSAATSRSNAALSAATSAANNKRTTQTSAANSKRSAAGKSGGSGANLAAIRAATQNLLRQIPLPGYADPNTGKHTTQFQKAAAPGQLSYLQSKVLSTKGVPSNPALVNRIVSQIVAKRIKAYKQQIGQVPTPVPGTNNTVF